MKLPKHAIYLSSKKYIPILDPSKKELGTIFLYTYGTKARDVIKPNHKFKHIISINPEHKYYDIEKDEFDVFKEMSDMFVDKKEFYKAFVDWLKRNGYVGFVNPDTGVIGSIISVIPIQSYKLHKQDKYGYLSDRPHHQVEKRKEITNDFLERNQIPKHRHKFYHNLLEGLIFDNIDHKKINKL